jgi:hypothetical protein
MLEVATLRPRPSINTLLLLIHTSAVSKDEWLESRRVHCLRYFVVCPDAEQTAWLSKLRRSLRAPITTLAPRHRFSKIETRNLQRVDGKSGSEGAVPGLVHLSMMYLLPGSTMGGFPAYIRFHLLPPFVTVL